VAISNRFFHLSDVDRSCAIAAIPRDDDDGFITDVDMTTLDDDDDDDDDDAHKKSTD